MFPAFDRFVQLTLNCILLSTMVTCNCGFPGIPANATMVGPQPSQYLEGTNVQFACIRSQDVAVPFEQSRTCRLGEWTGQLGRCAEPVSPLISIERFESVRTHDKKKLFKLEANTGQLNSNLSERLSRKIVRINRLAASTSRGSDLTALHCLALVTSAQQELNFYLNHATKSFYVELMVNMPADTYHQRPGGKDQWSSYLHLQVSPLTQCHVINENSEHSFSSTNDMFVRLIEPFARKVHEQSSEGSSTATVLDAHLVTFRFICELLDTSSTADHRPAAVEYISQKVTIRLEPMYLADQSQQQLALCGLKLFDFEPFKCGMAEIPLNGQRENPSNNANDISSQLIRYICHDGFELVGDMMYRQSGGLECGLDGKWIGSFPACRPRVTCQLDRLFKDAVDHQLNVEVENHVHWNRTEIAVKGTTVIFSCRSDQVGQRPWTLTGDQTQTCTRHGNWSSSLPRCGPSAVPSGPITDLNVQTIPVAASSLSNSILIITIITLIVFSLASLIVIVILYRRLSSMRTQTNPPNVPKIVTTYSFQSILNALESQSATLPRAPARPARSVLYASAHYESLVGLDHHNSRTTTYSNVYDDVTLGQDLRSGRDLTPTSDYLEVIAEEEMDRISMTPIYSNIIRQMSRTDLKDDEANLL